MALEITNGADKVWSRIYIGDMETAENLEMIRDYEFTHILNCAHSFRHAGQIYDGMDITYMGIQAEDSPFYDMSAHFKSAAEFIDSAVRGGGKVLVHCHAGVSRSATIVLAYLMLKHNMNLSSAIFMVKWSRGILPNVGFLRQLIDLQEELRAH